MGQLTKRAIAIAGAMVLASCGSAPPPVAAPPEPVKVEPSEPERDPALEAAAKKKAEEESKPTFLEVPEKCASITDGVCTPPRKFTEHLCLNTPPGFPLTMFRKGSPWTRAYLRVNMEGWYAGAARSHPQLLRQTEEVLILADRNKKGDGMQIEGAGSYDIYRWNGTCVSVMNDEVTLKRPPVPRASPIPWRRLEEDVRKVLLEDKGIAFQNDMRRKFCKPGKTDGRPCKNAKRALTQLIAEFVRKGGEVPLPAVALASE